MSALRVVLLAIWICALHATLRGLGIGAEYGTYFVLAALPAVHRSPSGWLTAFALSAGVIVLRANESPYDVLAFLVTTSAAVGTAGMFRWASSSVGGGAPLFDDSPMESVEREMHRARRYGRPLSLVVFRRVDRGMTETERNEVAAAIARQTNGADVVFAHEQMVALLLPETTAGGASSAANRLVPDLLRRQGVDLKPGFAEFPEEEVTLSGLLNRATARSRGEEPPAVDEEDETKRSAPVVGETVLAKC